MDEDDVHSVLRERHLIGRSTRHEMAVEFFKAIVKKIDNDEIIGPGWVQITTNKGDLPLVHLLGDLLGDGGHYKVRFGMS